MRKTASAAYPSESKLVPFFAAACLFMSAVEYAVPKPLPFLRLGFANVPILLALPKFDLRSLCLLVLLKILGQGFIGGTFFSYIFLFSAAGSCASAAAMKLLFHLSAMGRARRRPFLSYTGLSIAGALANTASQLALSQLFLFRDGTKYIAPLLWISASVTGLILGAAAETFAGTSKWYASLQDRFSPPQVQES